MQRNLAPLEFGDYLLGPRDGALMLDEPWDQGRICSRRASRTRSRSVFFRRDELSEGIHGFLRVFPFGADGYLVALLRA
jgi:hypothetical protein